MTTFSTVNGDFIAVEVPEEAQYFKVYHNGYGEAVLLYHTVQGQTITLPNAEYGFLATSDTITEQQAAEIVEATLAMRKWKDYNGNVLHKTSLYSFRSLLASLSITQRVAILKVNK